jgi:hypothetical protein
MVNESSGIGGKISINIGGGGEARRKSAKTAAVIEMPGAGEHRRRILSERRQRGIIGRNRRGGCSKIISEAK